MQKNKLSLWIAGQKSFIIIIKFAVTQISI